MRFAKLSAWALGGLVGMVLAIGVEQLQAQSGGGFPSNPTFQSLTVRNASSMGGALTMSAGSNINGAGNLCTAAGGLKCPWVISFIVGSTGGTASPTITLCNHCSSPTINRLGVGNWQLVPGVTLAANDVVLCTWFNPPNNAATLFIVPSANSGGNSVIIDFEAAGGATTDPTSTASVQCAVGV